ncbi:hypothetical protein MACH26_41900 [Planctobacterium marinum]|uniref:Transporter n=2 Tax=Planctobacterium marinum TaxID=1631968 RepID=A0AA48HVD4_9ALTE|nr:hypothetical protein MACH26_41900 [Planctobacterium marinum]
MSLQELFSASTEDAEPNSQNWTWSLRYQQAEFDGYLKGADKLSLDEVLFTPGAEPRTDSNFPVVPTVITQRASILGIQYQWRPEWQFNLVLPYIQQETDHISAVPGYETFLLKSHGPGDLSLGARYVLAQQLSHQWALQVKLSIPTGSIDERGDTPRAPGDQQLPYTMQLGSGTWDIPLTLSYQSLTEHQFEVDLSATIRTGKNDRDYRLGNRYSVKGKYRYQNNESLHTILGLEYVHSQSIQGADTALLVAQTNPYPASITNPDLYGGKKLLASIGIRWRFSDAYSLGLEMAKPLYQYLNGPQPKENWRAGIAFSSSR